MLWGWLSPVCRSCLSRRLQRSFHENVAESDRLTVAVPLTTGLAAASQHVRLFRPKISLRGNKVTLLMKKPAHLVSARKFQKPISTCCCLESSMNGCKSQFEAVGHNEFIYLQFYISGQQLCSCTQKPHRFNFAQLSLEKRCRFEKIYRSRRGAGGGGIQRIQSSDSVSTSGVAVIAFSQIQQLNPAAKPLN